MDVVKSMKIIIADAKSLKEKHFPIEKQTPLFFNKAESLRKQLKELDINQIHDLMKISFKQSSLIYDYFHNEETFAAINLFNGSKSNSLSGSIVYRACIIRITRITDRAPCHGELIIIPHPAA